eukprot:m.150959 g.150959  ORF g.150959 m.150959 type:complete len:68 (-) comp14240_c0_seq5:1466-1669(-)
MYFKLWLLVVGAVRKRQDADKIAACRAARELKSKQEYLKNDRIMMKQSNVPSTPSKVILECYKQTER